MALGVDHRVAPGRTRLWALVSTAVAAALACGLLAFSASSAAADEEFDLTLDHGHVDAFTPVWEDGNLRMRLQEDVTGSHVLHDASDVLLRVKESARTTLPSPVPPSMS